MGKKVICPGLDFKDLRWPLHYVIRITCKYFDIFIISGKTVRAENGRQFLDGSATQISRRDVAKYMLDIIQETSVYKACVAVGVDKN